MTLVKISLNEKFNRPLRKMAQEYGVSFSDIMNEVAEWVLDQKDDFRKDLEESLGEEEEETEEESE